MAGPVRIVVDSTADIPPDLAARLGITVVPLTVRFGNEVFRDRIDLSIEQFMQRLATSRQLPTSAQPPPGEFLTAYRQLLDAGAGSIIVITISAQLSGTYNSAGLAARDLVDPARPIDVIDSRTATMTCGLVAIEAARAAADGAAHGEVLALVHDLLGRTHLAALLNTLEYVQRGGRIGRARALVGTLLSVKPLITVTDGVVTPLEQVRTRQKAITRLVERTATLAERGLERLAVLHAADAANADLVADQLATFLPREQIIVTQIGPVIAVYTGPGALAVCAITQR